MIIKICGIQNKENLFCCEKNKVDFFGMIFYKKSPRNISFENANELQKLSKELNINGVGVFVNENINKLIELINYLELKFVQLHGEEDYNYINQLKKLKIQIIKKISVKEIEDIYKINNYSNADFFLFDYKPKNNELPGGNSKSFNWDLLNYLKTTKPWFLSGGINIDNIEHIKRKILPFGIDLSSGVEKELGIKDNQTINNFMDKLKNA